MKREIIKDFLKFRLKFTKREWHEINQIIDAHIQKKIDEMQLTDQDIEVLEERIKKVIQ